MTTTSMEQQQHGGANSSQDEGKIKEENDSNNNRRKRVESSSSPSTSFNDETHKNDESLTQSTDERNIKKDSDVDKQGKELESTKAEIGEVMEENQRLKQYLNKMMTDYQMLQSKFHEISQQDSKQLKIMAATPPPPSRASCDEDEEEADKELVSLSLGRSPSLDSKKGYTNKLSSPSKLATNHSKYVDMEANERSLDLGLECKFKASSTTDHPQNLNETKYSEALKSNNVTTGGNSNGDDELVHQPPMKKARVSVRVRCDTPTMNDGCQWRKYGQKIAKGNPCPRAYYRCTVAPSCPVRKQVVTMSTPSRKRLMRDFKRLQQDPPAGISGAPHDNNIMLWNAVIFGPDDTPWDGDGSFVYVVIVDHHLSLLSFSVSVLHYGHVYRSSFHGGKWLVWFVKKILSEELSRTALKSGLKAVIIVKRRMRTYQAIVKVTSNFYADGSICLDILQNQWSPIYDVAAILTSIQSLLCDPNPNSPANSEAARLFSENKREYNRRVREIVEQSWTAD
uniref:Uncharacterized protein n=1 Tax=Chenopodium quinoa TaxID=63459 RepID=A0A803M197_CHEQI